MARGKQRPGVRLFCVTGSIRRDLKIVLEAGSEQDAANQAVKAFEEWMEKGRHDRVLAENDDWQVDDEVEVTESRAPTPDDHSDWTEAKTVTSQVAKHLSGECGDRKCWCHIGPLEYGAGHRGQGR